MLGAPELGGASTEDKCLCLGLQRNDAGDLVQVTALKRAEKGRESVCSTSQKGPNSRLQAILGVGFFPSSLHPSFFFNRWGN